MTDNHPQRTELVDWLTQRGHTPIEVEKILAKLDEYDAKTVRESIFDSIDEGSFDIATLIEEALADEA